MVQFIKVEKSSSGVWKVGKRRMQFYTSQFKSVSPKRKRDERSILYTCLFKLEQRFAINKVSMMRRKVQ